jgi:adenylate kinase
VGVIFVSGIHGVGKGTQCQLYSQCTGIPWYSASSIIKTEKQSAIAVNTKAVEDPIENQNLLLRGVRRVLTSIPTILLDGHFTVLDSQNSIVRIDVEVFVQLQLQGIVVLKDSPFKICDRLRKRDGRKWAVDNVSSHQQEEITHAQMVATKLTVPLFIVEGLDNGSFMKAVGAILG